jgi:tetratricopeptide (TPR) repeat protein
LAKAHPSGELARDASALGSAAPSLAASASAEKAQPAPPLAKEASASPAGPDCLALARQGQTREAERCFVERARGSGLGAEMALYELGRLRRNVLADPVGALSALEEHALRFPGGSLRREVQMSSLELLVQLGRSQEALERSSALLAAQAGGGRAAELYLLRGDIFRRSLHDLRAAEREYGSAERLAGSAEAEATYLRGVCLEGLGESSAASEAYRRYLAKPSRPRAADVQRRLERLELP